MPSAVQTDLACDQFIRALSPADLLIHTQLVHAHCLKPWSMRWREGDGDGSSTAQHAMFTETSAMVRAAEKGEIG